MFSRRQLLSVLGTAALAGRGPARADESAVPGLRHRLLGRTGRWVTPLGLGGQASLQWTAQGIDPADIIVRAVERGVNYLDSANAYGPSQANYGQAFRRLALAPGQPDYDPALRASLFIASKTVQRYAYDRSRPAAATAVTELKQSLTTMFGDGRGWIPDEAYLDSIQIHALGSIQQVDQIYEGFDIRTDGRPRDRIGALAGLADYRDGTNHTGLNPERKHYIRHIGITSHQSSPVLMNALQRDQDNIIDTMLVALNANDRKYSSHQYNAVPVAVARGLGVIAMKAFADGSIYGKAPRFSTSASDLILTVGQPGGTDPAGLVRYPLSIPGVSTAIIGTGKIDRDRPEGDQLVNNLAAAITDVAGAAERIRIEDDVAAHHGTGANYFQDSYSGLIHPPKPAVSRDSDRVVIRWTTGFAGAEPIRSYRIYSGGQLLASIPFRPQTTTEPLSISLPASEIGSDDIRVEASEAYPA